MLKSEIPIVLLHASGSSARQWKHLVEQIDGKAYAIDLCDHGRRVGQPLLPFTLSAEASAIERLLENLGGAYLIGHSYGGAVAINLARRRPDLVHALAVYEPSLLMLLQHDAGSRTEWNAVVANVTDIIKNAMQGRLEAAARRFVAMWSGEDVWDSMQPEQQQSFAAHMPAIKRHFYAVYGEPLVPGDFAALPMPRLLMHGERTVPMAARIIELLHGALPADSNAQVRCEQIKEAGHMGPVTHAEAVNRHILQFLASLAPGRQPQGLTPAATASYSPA